MQTKNLLILGGAGILLYYFSKAKAAALINYNINSVALNFKGITPVLKILLNVQNVTNESIIINSMTGNLFIDNTNVGSISNFNQTLIANNSQSVYEIVVSLNLLGVVSDLINLITNHSGISKTVQIVANANVEGLIIPINAKYTIS